MQSKWTKDGGDGGRAKCSGGGGENDLLIEDGWENGARPDWSGSSHVIYIVYHRITEHWI